MNNKINGFREVLKEKTLFSAALTMSAFFLAYILYYILPSLFHGGEEMKQLQLLPFLDPVGADLEIYLRFIESWKQGTDFQFSEFNIYPPLNTLFFLPMTWLPYLVSFGLITILSYLALVYVVVVFPFRMTGDKNTFFITFPALMVSLMTYPFLFEIERGQFNLIAMAVCFYGIELRKRESIWGYVLFILSVQFKVFPAIFVFFFALKDWKKYFYLGGINFILLWSLGYKKFVHFFHAIKVRSGSDVFIAEVNTSIDSFFRLTERVMGEWGNTGALKVLPTIESLAYLSMFLILALGAYVFYKKQSRAVESSFLLICTIVTLLLPQTSHDYKISYLAGPLIYFIVTLSGNRINQVAIWLMSFSYSTMLWHFWEHKQNTQVFRINTPGLFIILFTCLIPLLNYFKQKNEAESASENK